MLLRVRIVSYNVLSSHLATPSSYPLMDPFHLNPTHRLPIIFQKLEQELYSKPTSKTNHHHTTTVTTLLTNDGPNSNDTTTTTAKTTTTPPSDDHDHHDNGMDKSHPNHDDLPVIFCLQEVSYEWAGAFHTWFANRGYHLVTGLYGKKYNGYMGIALAYPTNIFETIQIHIDRLSDTRPYKWPRPPQQPRSSPPSTPAETRDVWSSTTSVLIHVVQQTQSVFQKVKTQTTVSLKRTLSLLSSSWKRIQGEEQGQQEQQVVDHWAVAENRHNVMLCATLRHKPTGQAFCIGNYHMPCVYYAPMVMTIHADLAIRYVQHWALIDSATAAAAATTTTTTTTTKTSTTTTGTTTMLPYIVAGDWNIVPTSATYRMITTGELDPSDPTFPTPKYGTEWRMTMKEPMQSAYALCSSSSSSSSSEPDFTNYGCQGDDIDKTFIDTLDYIFVSQNKKNHPQDDDDDDDDDDPSSTSSTSTSNNRNWKVTHVKPIPHRSQVKGPFPHLHQKSDDDDNNNNNNNTNSNDVVVGEPSDHVLISADLELEVATSPVHDDTNDEKLKMF